MEKISNNTTNQNQSPKGQIRSNNTSVIILILSIVSSVLTFFAPFVTRTTEGLFRATSTSCSLFDSVNSGFCIALMVIAGIGLIIFSCIGAFSNPAGKGRKGIGYWGMALLIMQIVCTNQAMNYYDNSSLFSEVRSALSSLSIHPLAVVTMLLTIANVILCFKASSKK